MVFLERNGAVWSDVGRQMIGHVASIIFFPSDQIALEEDGMKKLIQSIVTLSVLPTALYIVVTGGNVSDAKTWATMVIAISIPYWPR
jgi:hypothetical protein